MDKQEILTAIRKTIKGQGSAVDVGGKLADVLTSIVELIPDEPEPSPSDYNCPEIEVTGNFTQIEVELAEADAIVVDGNKYPRLALSDALGLKTDSQGITLESTIVGSIVDFLGNRAFVVDGAFGNVNMEPGENDNLILSSYSLHITFTDNATHKPYIYSIEL